MRLRTFSSRISSTFATSWPNIRAESPGLFDQFIDRRLLDVPLLRVAPHDPPPDGVIHLLKDAEKEDGLAEER